MGGRASQVGSDRVGLVLLLFDAILEKDEIRSGLVLAVVHQDDHALGIHLLAEKETEVVEILQNLLSPF